MNMLKILHCNGVNSNYRVCLAVTLVVLSGCASSLVNSAGGCRAFPTGPGPEDFEIYEYPNGETYLLISSAPRGKLFSHPPGSIQSARLMPHGGIGSAAVVEIVTQNGALWEGRHRFHPVGISLVRDLANRRDLLYAINTGSDENSIEVFELDPSRPGKWTWWKTLQHKLLTSPNDLLAFPDGQVYVSNAFDKDNSVVHRSIDPETGSGQWRHTGVPAMKFANGIAVNIDGDRLYVADFSSKRINVFVRNPQTGRLGEDYCTVDLGAHPDNLTWGDQEHRELYVAAHVSQLRSALHLYLSMRAPSRVLRIDTSNITIPNGVRGKPCGASVDDVLSAEDLKPINAASTAAFVDGRVIVSQLKRAQIFECRQPD
jgi:hypothetical protein